MIENRNKKEYNLEARTSAFGEKCILNFKWKEAQELTLIFGKIISKLNN